MHTKKCTQKEGTKQWELYNKIPFPNQLMDYSLFLKKKNASKSS